MSYTVTTLGQSLPVVGSGQAFEPTVQNANSLLLESTLLTTRTSVQVLQGQLRSPADLNALAALVGMTQGQLALVQEGGALFEYSGTAWVQQTPAAFASTAARDTAYAKASGAYKVQSAVVQITGQLYPLFYSVLAAAWKGGTAGGGRFQVKPVLAGGTGIVVGADGSVVFTAAPGAGILTFATADFDNYEVEIEMFSTAANTVLVMQACVGGALDSAANYYYAGGTNAAGSSTVSGWQAASVSSWDLARPGASIAAMSRIGLKLLGFFSATKQSSIINQSISNTGTGAVHVASGGFYNVAKSHDGVAFTPASGGTTLTGVARFYGINNG